MTTATHSLGIDADRLLLLPTAIRADIDAEKYDGAVVLVARRGEVVLVVRLSARRRLLGSGNPFSRRLLT